MEAQPVSSVLDSAATGSEQTTTNVLGKEAFLELLIAQLKNQNPLDPLDDQQFIAQMTQFSSLEQLQNMNDSLSENVQWDMLMSQTITNTMATSLIGKEVIASTASVAIEDGEASDVTFDTSEFATNGTITIYNSDGVAVRMLDVSSLPAGQNSISWNGKDANGNQLADGTYSVSFDLYGTNGEAIDVDGYLKGVVTGVKYIQGQAYLAVNGTLVPLSDIREVNSEGA